MDSEPEGDELGAERGAAVDGAVGDGGGRGGVIGQCHPPPTPPAQGSHVTGDILCLLTSLVTNITCCPHPRWWWVLQGEPGLPETL